MNQARLSCSVAQGEETSFLLPSRQVVLLYIEAQLRASQVCVIQVRVGQARNLATLFLPQEGSFSFEDPAALEELYTRACPPISPNSY